MNIITSIFFPALKYHRKQLALLNESTRYMRRAHDNIQLGIEHDELERKADKLRSDAMDLDFVIEYHDKTSCGYELLLYCMTLAMTIFSIWDCIMIGDMVFFFGLGMHSVILVFIIIGVYKKQKIKEEMVLERI